MLTYVVLLVMLAPVIWLLISSVQDDLELSTGAYDLLHPTFRAFSGMWQTIDFERYFLNSLIICTSAAVLATCFASSAGYALAAIPARFALEQRAWKDAAALEAPKATLAWERFPYALALTHFARAIGAARLGDAAAASAAVDGIAGIKAQGKAILYTTQYMEEAELLCDRIAIIDNGLLKIQGTLEELLANSEHPVVAPKPRGLSELFLQLTGREFRDN